MLDNLKNYTIIGLLIALPFATIGGYIKGKRVGANELEQHYKQLEQANTVYWQSVVNKLNESANQARLNNELRFKGLSNEFLQISNDLRLCQYNNNQLRLIKTAANLPITTRTKMDSGANARILANDESREFTCQDSGLTLIKWGELYFQCKDKLDYFQTMWSNQPH